MAGVMRIRVDQARCVGHGRCHAVAGELFPLDEMGSCAVSEADVPEGLESLARAGASNCPERVITIIERTV
jgi:ferredoxin